MRYALRATLVGIVIVVAGFTVFGQQPATNRPAAAPSSGVIGRYQHSGEFVDRVFDTQTGRIYVLMPRDDKAGEDAHLIIRDVVNGTMTFRSWRVVDERRN